MTLDLLAPVTDELTDGLGDDVFAVTPEVDLLRFSTAGSVDDGKSTLIGRLLYDSKTLFVDQLDHVERTSLARGDERVDLALLTDGLRAEREQGITIDVAYRYFATPRRRFIIADTPGHVQYTRNMVTGASTTDLAVVLVDARHGFVEQSRRHAAIASLLGIPHLVVAVNKMDLVGWSEARFDEIRAEVVAFAAELAVTDVTFIPMSALLGDNVVERSTNLPWFDGDPLLAHLEAVRVPDEGSGVGARFPVQWVIRPRSGADLDYRGYAGTVAAGTLRVGDPVVALPSGRTSTIATIDRFEGPVDEAGAGMAVTVRLTDDLDVSRGELLVHPSDRPVVGQDLEAELCWLGEQPLLSRGLYTLKHTTNSTRALVTEVVDQLEVPTGGRDPGAIQLGTNDLGRVRLRATTPLVYDPYRRNRATGGFILIDEVSNTTVAAGMLLPPPR
jgi:bifunctional enzyme CysN/CysC